ncbi:MAG TPA: VWA domain-containing protein [Thermoleophilaceae bacterium]
MTSTSSPPGSVMNATVTASVSNATWRATAVQFGSQTSDCVDHANQGSGTNRHVSFKVTAPGGPGNYDVAFKPNEGDSCNGTAGSTFTLIDGLRVTKPAPNPNLPPRCGINVMLVLDKSGSIASSGQTETVKSATRAFLDALSGTGAKVSIVDFSSTAARPVGYTTVTPETIASTFDPYLANGYKPSGYTNWEAAFQKVREANTQGTLADLVVFITDGDPTARNTATGVQTGLTEGDVTAMRPAAEQADLVKSQGSHVFALGVGAAVTKPASAHRLTAISGFNQLPPFGLSKADYTLVQDFDDLAAALREIANALCAASVTVTKLVDEGDGQYKPDPGWTFTATVSTDPGDYDWLQPAPPPSSGPRSETTNESGVATFQWQPSSSTATSTVSLDEDVKPGFRFVDATCTRNSPTRKRRRPITRTSEPVTQLTLKPNEYYKCTVRNQILPGTIEIEKRATPTGSTQFPFTGTLGPFTLVDDGSGTSSKIFTGLVPGTYTVSELVPQDWELTGVTCTPAAAGAITGADVTITLAPNASVVCTYSDLRTDPPVPPEPPNPPVPPGPPTPPPSPPPAQIVVRKTAPRVAHVGQRVPFKLTVVNTGAVAATNVQLADVPSAAMTLAGLSTNRPLRRVRGNAVWRFGTLAPGARATVRGSVQIKAGSPGLKRNLVLATAVNAKLAAGHADTRIVRARLAPRRTLPRFTG